MSAQLYSRYSRALVPLVVLSFVAGCAGDSPTSPLAASRSEQGNAPTMAGKPVPTGAPTGERVVGRAAIEPAFDAETGNLMYLLTPEKAPLPSKANGHAVSPLYIVEYPAGSAVAGADIPVNCMGVPGNCPDHDGLVAGIAMDAMPSVYPAVLGHDHVADAPGGADFNVAWEVIEVVFKNSAAADTRLTTDAQIEAALAADDIMEIDLGFAFNCSAVSARAYWKGTPVG